VFDAVTNKKSGNPGSGYVAIVSKQVMDERMDGGIAGGWIDTFMRSVQPATA